MIPWIQNQHNHDAAARYLVPLLFASFCLLQHTHTQCMHSRDHDHHRLQRDDATHTKEATWATRYSQSRFDMLTTPPQSPSTCVIHTAAEGHNTHSHRAPPPPDTQTPSPDGPQQHRRGSQHPPPVGRNTSAGRPQHPHRGVSTPPPHSRRRVSAPPPHPRRGVSTHSPHPNRGVSAPPPEP